MTFFSRLSVENRPGFEALVTRVALVGLAAGVLSAPVARDFSALWPLVLGAVVGVTLLGASLLRGAPAVQPFSMRVLAAAAAVACGVCLGSLPAAVLVAAAAAGGVHAGPRGTSSGRQLAGAVG